MLEYRKDQRVVTTSNGLLAGITPPNGEIHDLFNSAIGLRHTRRRAPSHIGLYLSDKRLVPAIVQRAAKVVASHSAESKQTSRDGFPNARIESIDASPHEVRLNGLKSGATSQDRDISVLAKIAVLEAGLALIKELDGHKPTVNQLVGVLAIHPRLDGLNGQGFLQALRHLTNTEQRFPEQTFWKGKGRNILAVFAPKNGECADQNKVTLSASVIQTLYRSPGQLFESGELVAQVKEDKLAINRCLNVLLMIGLVVRHPDHKNQETDRMESVWSSAHGYYVKPPLRNPELVLLDWATNNPEANLSDLYSDSGQTAGRIFSHHAIAGALKHLEQIGLAKESTRKSSPHGRFWKACKLTEDGIRLAIPWSKVGIGHKITADLYEPLRSRLLVESSDG